MSWKQIREEEAEECLARQRAEQVAEEGFDVDPDDDEPAGGDQ